MSLKSSRQYNPFPGGAGGGNAKVRLNKIDLPAWHLLPLWYFFSAPSFSHFGI
jgi:hypothetical protein